MEDESELDFDLLDIDQSSQTELYIAGLTKKSDFDGLDINSLSTLCGFEKRTSREILRKVQAASFSQNSNTTQLISSRGSTAFEQMKNAKRSEHVITFCQELDKILGGGISVGGVTEICGVPGIGKTQFGIQLAVNVQIPKSLSGLEGKAIYIDSEGSFMLDRVKTVANGYIKKVNGMLEKRNISRELTLTEVLDNIFYYRVNNYVQQVALINVLGKFIEANKDVKIVIIDSITFHFRHEFKDYGHRARILQSVAARLSHLAETRGVAVVVVNQMTTRIDESSNTSKMIPALGESWAHACPTRIILYKRGIDRIAYLFKSAKLKSQESVFSITNDGVRDVTRKRKRDEESISSTM